MKDLSIFFIWFGKIFLRDSLGGGGGGGEIDFLLITSIFHQSRGEEESLKTNKLKRHPPGSFNFSIANATDRVYSNANAIDRVLISD